MSMNLTDAGTIDDTNIFMFGIWALAVDHQEHDIQEYSADQKHMLMQHAFGADADWYGSHADLALQMYRMIRQTLKGQERFRWENDWPS